MPRKMLINALHSEESRVAIVDDNGRLVDLDIEITGSEQMRGNIYKGVVLRVEPGLQAAFIDIGLKKPGFLQMGELHPDKWQWRDDLPDEQRKKRPRMQEVLRRGQEVLVQVEKDERDMKGAALTSYISLPGRYMVIMPGSDSSGISRKVEGEGERKKLKDLVKEMTLPEGVGYIIRTEAMGRTVEELQRDLDQLVTKYRELLEKSNDVKAPALVYREHAVVIRTIRDYFSADIDELLVDSKEVFKEAKAFFKETMPKFEKRVKMHEEKRPIFSRFQIEEQIDQIYEKKVLLKSGGSLVIEPTEALVSIDVNSGKSTGERGVEDTAFRTNMEAAEEAARQLRLRDLGGLIVLDFIDMRESKHVKEVEKTLKGALKSDKARVTVGRISQFGMLEMSRQRIKQTLEQGSILDCPHCNGRGKVKGVESMALSFMRKVHATAAKGNAAEIRGELPLEVAYYLLNRKKRDLAQIENDYDIEITIKGKPSFLMNQLDLIVLKREKTHAVEHAQTTVEWTAEQPEEFQAASEAAVEMAEEAKTKKKRKSRKKADALAVENSSAAETATEAISAAPLLEEMSTGEALTEAAPEEHKKKRKRKRRRKGKGGQVEQLASEAAKAHEESEVIDTPEQAPSAGEESGGSEHHKKRKRRRRKRSGTGTADDAGTAFAPESSENEAPEETAPLIPDHEYLPPAASSDKAPAKQSRRPARKRVEKKTPDSAPPPVFDDVGTEPPVVYETTVKAPQKRTRSKKAVQPAEGYSVPTDTPVVELSPTAEEKPKRKRAPARKKSVLPEG